MQHIKHMYGGLRTTHDACCCHGTPMHVSTNTEGDGYRQGERKLGDTYKKLVNTVSNDVAPNSVQAPTSKE
jgi:hypothetical protein